MTNQSILVLISFLERLTEGDLQGAINKIESFISRELEINCGSDSLIDELSHLVFELQVMVDRCEIYIIDKSEIPTKPNGKIKCTTNTNNN